jgi:hypothetical protein
MPDETVNVYRFDYEMDESSWVAYVAGFNNEDAGAHLFKTVGKVIKVTTTGFECRLDSLSEKVTNSLLLPYIQKIEKLQAAKEKLKLELESRPKRRKPGRKPKEKEEIKIGIIK